MLKNLLLIVLTVLINTTGQFVIKTGVNRIGKISITENLFGTILKALTSWIIIGGFGLYFISAIFWIIILSRAELSWAFPILSLSYVITVLISPLLLNESFSVQRLIGTLVICAGVYLVSRTF
jgi:drug/metabolite transporter (DMT)-like permease